MTPPLSAFGNLDPSCPWSELIRRHPPNVKWCEEPLCAWIREPANTWSNLAFLLLGLWILRDPRGGRLGRTFGWSTIALGAASFAYHAATNFPLQLLDFAGMYAFGLLPLLLNLHRLGALREQLSLRLYLGGVAALVAVTPLVRRLGLPIQGIVGLLVLGILVTEALTARRGPAAGDRQAPSCAGASLPAPRTGAGGQAPRRLFLLSIGLLLLAGLASALDVSRLACDPRNHLLQGHAVWHVLSAASLGAAWRYYRDLLQPAPPLD